MSISFLSLFFFSKMLIFVTEWLDIQMKNLGKSWKRLLLRKWRKHREEEEDHCEKEAKDR